jgi:hypothetical protein
MSISGSGVVEHAAIARTISKKPAERGITVSLFLVGSRKYAPNRLHLPVKEFLLGLLALGAAPLFAADLLLAPGKSITILDAADPSVRVVLNAPADRPLNLSAILANDAGGSVYSIVTRMQVDSAGALARRADGSIGLSASPGAALPAGEMLQGGVLVFTASPERPGPKRSAT